jgi:hypothetical protein
MGKIRMLLAGLAVAAAASGGELGLAAYYQLSAVPDYDYFDGFREAVHGGGVKATWAFREPFGAEVAASARAESGTYGGWIPEYLPPDSRFQLPVTAALTAGTPIWRVYTYAVAGVGAMWEINRRGVSWREVDYPTTVHPLALWGAGVRGRVAAKIFAEFSARYAAVAGDQLAFWDMNDGFRYRQGHPDVVELTVAIGAYL